MYTNIYTLHTENSSKSKEKWTKLQRKKKRTNERTSKESTHKQQNEREREKKYIRLVRKLMFISVDDDDDVRCWLLAITRAQQLEAEVDMSTQLEVTTHSSNMLDPI